MGKLVVFGILSLDVPEQLASESWRGENQGNKKMVEELWSSEIFILLQFFVQILCKFTSKLCKFTSRVLNLCKFKTRDKGQSKPIFYLYDLECK